MDTIANFTLAYLDSVIANIDRILNMNILSEYDLKMFIMEFRTFKEDLLKNVNIPPFIKTRVQKVEILHLRKVVYAWKDRTNNTISISSIGKFLKRKKILKESLIELKDEMVDVRILIMQYLQSLPGRTTAERLALYVTKA